MTISAYEQLRLDRIKRNHERLKELGLDKYVMKRPKKNKQRTKRLLVERGEERRSKRRQPSKKDKENDPGNGCDFVVMLDYNDAGDGEEKVAKQQYDRQHYHYGNDKTDGSKQHFPLKRRRTNIPEEYKLSEKDRASLAGSADSNFMAKFQEFLESQNRISPQNVRNVMRQARKLASGEGIRYESPRYGWEEGCYFQRGVKITPMSDLVELMKEGQECEDRWGRDHGNGWLLSHPLKKLLLFQQFILENPDFLTSALRLKDYCEW